MAGSQIDALVVDDQPPVRQMMRLMLGQFGLKTVELARDGREAVSILLAQTPRVVISDVNMPNMNGLELLKRIRSGETGGPRDLPVLMLTGHGEAGVVVTAVALDIDGFVLKPASPATLKPRIDRALAGRKVHLKPAEAYQAVAVPEVSVEGISDPLPPLEAAPGSEILPLGRAALGRTVAAGVMTKGGLTVLEAGTVLADDMLLRLIDLAEIGLVNKGVVVRT